MSGGSTTCLWGWEGHRGERGQISKREGVQRAPADPETCARETRRVRRRDRFESKREVCYSCIGGIDHDTRLKRLEPRRRRIEHGHAEPGEVYTLRANAVRRV